jgi:hypothetical protein
MLAEEYKAWSSLDSFLNATSHNDAPWLESTKGATPPLVLVVGLGTTVAGVAALAMAVVGVRSTPGLVVGAVKFAVAAFAVGSTFRLEAGVAVLAMAEVRVGSAVGLDEETFHYDRI